MGLMDAYGPFAVSVQAWGLRGRFSVVDLCGGLVIAKWGSAKPTGEPCLPPYLHLASALLYHPASIILLTVGMLSTYRWDHSSKQRNNNIKKWSRRTFRVAYSDFAQSVEMAASPLTTFFIVPIAELIFIPL